MPTPAKYKESYFDDELPQYTISPLPFSSEAIYKAARGFYDHMYLHEAEQNGDLIIVRNFCRQHKISADRFVHYARRSKHAVYVKVPGACKPLVALPAAELARLLVKKRRHNPVKRISSEWSLTKESLKKWLENLPERAEPIKKFYQTLIEPDVIYTKIESIKKGISDVYDLKVDKAEHFTANGFVVHNCKHLIALFNLMLAKKLIT